MSSSKVTVIVNKTAAIIKIVIGIALLVVFGVATIYALTDKESMAQLGAFGIIVLVIFDIIGILFVLSARKTFKLIKEFKKYVAVIACSPNGYIPDIAASLGKAENVVKENLELMIKKKYFINAFTDANENCFVIANKNKVEQFTQECEDDADTYSDNAAPQSNKMVTVTCKGCGAVNTIPKGAVRECEYCGSSIKGE